MNNFNAALIVAMRCNVSKFEELFLILDFKFVTLFESLPFGVHFANAH